MRYLLEKWAQKAKDIPMPFGGRVLLTLYWWLWRLVGSGRNWDNFNEVKAALTTPLKVQAWLWANVEYASDKKDSDHWQPARVTFERRRGDCEDWCILACECLKRRYDCVYLCLYTKKTGHATLLVERGKSGKSRKWTSIGTYGYRSHKGREYDNIIPDWKGYKNWTSYTVKDEDINTILKKERNG